MGDRDTRDRVAVQVKVGDHWLELSEDGEFVSIYSGAGKLLATSNDPSLLILARGDKKKE
jgi:hypothetical protein